MKHRGMREGHMGHEPHDLYRHEVEKPMLPMEGHEGPGMGDRPGMGCMDFKAEADPIAYGQAAGEGMKSDHRKIESQFKEYHWE